MRMERERKEKADGSEGADVDLMEVEAGEDEVPAITVYVALSQFGPVLMLCQGTFRGGYALCSSFSLRFGHPKI
jgi:hypothetical protein